MPGAEKQLFEAIYIQKRSVYQDRLWTNIGKKLRTKAVFPQAAIFNHWDCLHYTDPLGVSLHLIRTVIVCENAAF